jgi:putative colanic acid biosynthesis UDP-glucose lipid carrier transferase
MFLYRYLSIYRIVLLNLFIAASFFLWKDTLYFTLANLFCCYLNISFLGIALYNLSKFIRRNHERLFIGRKRTLIVFTCGVFFVIHSLALLSDFIKNNLLALDFIWSLTALLVRMFENEASAFLYKILKKSRRVAVVGNTDTSLDIAEKLKRKGKNFFFGNVYFDDDNNFSGTMSFSPYIDFAKKNQINELYLPVSTIDPVEINTLTEQAEKHCIRINFIPNKKIENSGYQLHYISGMPVLKKYNEPLARLRNQTVKRTFDVIISGFVIVFILSWLIPLIGLLIKLESKGPIFFRQERSGRDNSSFVCLKFRSMRMNEQSDLVQATKNDMRVTKLGAFLRKTSIDELPQFINVFKGDMSLIGPRPHMLRHTEEYNELINHYMVRLYLKPGVTGWAQANGYRGEITEISLMRKRVEYDIWYMENWSLLLDIKILWLTLVGMIKGHENAY